MKDYTTASQPPASKPQHQGQVFTFSGEVAIESGDLIEGKCKVNGIILTVLYYSGAIHSFISYKCVRRLGLPVSKLPYDLEVSPPAGKQFRTSQAYLQCHLKIVDRHNTIDLICLPLYGLDIILGMNWLSANRIVLDCSNKTAMFPLLSSEAKKLVSLYLCSLESKSGRSGSQGYILLKESEVNLK